MKILYRGPVGTTGGYAKDGIGIIKALLDRRHDVSVEPTQVLPPLPNEIAALLTQPVADDGYDLELHHVPPTAVSMPYAENPRARKTVLWTMWEWDNVPEDTPGFEVAQEQMRNYEHVVLYTPQTLAAFQAAGFLGDDDPDFHILQGGIDPTFWIPAEGTAYEEAYPSRRRNKGEFIFAVLGHLTFRKNPFGILQAFGELQEEKGEEFDARLIMKTSYPLPSFMQDLPGVDIINKGNWSEGQVRQFYWSIDCLINCALGEGKDLPAMEAALCGTPIIINANDGHEEWYHPSIQTLVPVEPRSINGMEGVYTPIEDLKEAMWDVYSNRRRHFEQARQVSAYLRRSAAWDKKIERLGRAIKLPL